MHSDKGIKRVKSCKKEENMKMDRLNNHNIFRKFNHRQQYNVTFPYFKLLVYSDNEPSSYTFCTSALIRSPSCRYFLIMCSSSKDLLRYTWTKNKWIQIETEYNGIHQKDSAIQDFLIYLHSWLQAMFYCKIEQDWPLHKRQSHQLLYSNFDICSTARSPMIKKMSYTI